MWVVTPRYGLPTKHVKTFVDMVDHNKDGFLSVFELQDFFSTYERERVEDSTAAIRAKLPKGLAFSEGAPRGYSYATLRTQ